MAPAAAFFDLDKTIIARSSALAFGKPLYKAGLLNRRVMLKMAIGQTFYVLFGADHDKMERAREAMVSLTRGWDSDQLEELVEETLNEVVAPLVYAEALFLIDEHHREGRRVYIVSSSPEEIVKPLGHYLGIDDVIATRAKVDADGRYTGELEFYAYGETKADAVRALAAEGVVDLAESYAYSDSFTDTPLLEAVGHPVAVNPDRELRRHAEEQGWPIVEFKLPVNLRTRLQDLHTPPPLISGAAVATLAAAAVAVAYIRSKQKG